MHDETVLLSQHEDVLTITLNRPQQNNALNNALVLDMLKAIKQADDKTKIILLQGQHGVFCTGMDFQEVINERNAVNPIDALSFSANYMELLTTLATVNKIVVTKLNGKVLAGGVGLVAASDIVYASATTTFSLTEALWGLLPANVMPFLIRRIGFQPSYYMTITAETINAELAREYRLVDEILPNIDEQIRQKIARLRRLQTGTILDLKNYFNQMYEVTEETRQLAIRTLAELVTKDRVRNNIKNFVQGGLFPWS